MNHEHCYNLNKIDQKSKMFINFGAFMNHEQNKK